MKNAIQQYLARLSKGFGEGWNRFWFTPSDPFTACVLRVVAGAAAVFLVGSYTFDLMKWFGPDGLLPVETVQSVMETSPGEGAAYQWSYLNHISSPGLLWAVHAAGVAIVAMFALGLFTRVTSIASLIVVLSYVHRAPLLVGHLEPILAVMILYLCLTPCGRYLSLDRRRRSATGAAEIEPARSWMATVGVRLIQVHVSGLYLLMAFTKLGSTFAWWDGSAVWFLMAQSRSRLVDLTFLRNQLFLINAWTHAIVLFELCYAVLIWNRLARPLLIAASCIVWTLTALMTGLVPFCLLMIAAGAAFVPAEVWRAALCRNRAGLPPTDAAATGKAKTEAATAA